MRMNIKSWTSRTFPQPIWSVQEPWLVRWRRWATHADSVRTCFVRKVGKCQVMVKLSCVHEPFLPDGTAPWTGGNSLTVSLAHCRRQHCDDWMPLALKVLRCGSDSLRVSFNSWPGTCFTGWENWEACGGSTHLDCPEPSRELSCHFHASCTSGPGIPESARLTRLTKWIWRKKCVPWYQACLCLSIDCLSNTSHLRCKITPGAALDSVQGPMEGAHPACLTAARTEAGPVAWAGSSRRQTGICHLHTWEGTHVHETVT